MAQGYMYVSPPPVLKVSLNSFSRGAGINDRSECHCLYDLDRLLEQP